MADARDLALGIYLEALEAVRPGPLIRAACRVQHDLLIAGDAAIELGRYRRVLLCGAGKASCGLAQELLSLLGEWVQGGLVITKHGHGCPLGPVEVIESSHPVPDDRSAAAGQRMLEFASSCRSGDLVLFVLSGGASSLMESLPAGLLMQELAASTQKMLADGSDIQQINAWRKSVSLIKGGKLGVAYGLADVVCFVLSDVIGDDFGTIGSGPLWTDTIPHVLLGNNRTAVLAASASAAKRGLHVFMPELLTGDVRDGVELMLHYGRSFAGPLAIIAGGETLVRVTGSGMGGRCQHFAATAAAQIAGLEGIAVLAAGTDGTDGPTPYAGGVVEADSVLRAAEHGLAVDDSLLNNDSSTFLHACDGLITTGPTQSNVNDLYLFVRQ